MTAAAGRAARRRARARRRRARTLAATIVATAAGIAIGLAGTGVTSALLTGTASGGAAILTAGSARLLINGATTTTLPTANLSPANPGVWAFLAENTGDVPLALTAATTTGAPLPAYAAAVQAKMTPVAGSASCNASVTGTASPLGTTVGSGLGTLGIGRSQWFCLVLSVAPNTSASGTGSPLPFTLTLTGTQSAT